LTLREKQETPPYSSAKRGREGHITEKEKKQLSLRENLPLSGGGADLASWGKVEQEAKVIKGGVVGKKGVVC